MDTGDKILLYGGIGLALYLGLNFFKAATTPAHVGSQQVLPDNTEVNLAWNLNPFTIPVQEGFDLLGGFLT